MTDTDRIARVAKGKRPKYFDGPTVDKLHAIVMSLVAELSVTRDRLDTLERVLQQRGALDESEIDEFALDQAAQGERTKRREEYIRRVMRVVEMEVEEVDKRREGESFEAAFERLTSGD